MTDAADDHIAGRHGRQRHAGLRRVRDGVAAPQEDEQRRVPGVGVQVLRQGRERIHRAGGAEGGAGTQRPGHPRHHPRRGHGPGRPHQLPGVRAHDEGRHRLEERLQTVLQGQLQQPQPEALQGHVVIAIEYTSVAVSVSSHHHHQHHQHLRSTGSARLGAS